MTFVGMSAVEVVRVVEWLGSRSAVYQVNGGWAVDALYGSQTRSHGDLDIFVDATVVDDLIAWLKSAGYEIVEDWRPIRVELRRGDHAVDVHPMEIDANGDGVQRGFGDDTFVHRERERTVGEIGGRTLVVACAERLRELRTGYSLRAEDHHDLEILRALGGLRGERTVETAHGSYGGDVVDFRSDV